MAEEVAAAEEAVDQKTSRESKREEPSASGRARAAKPVAQRTGRGKVAA